MKNLNKNVPEQNINKENSFKKKTKLKILAKYETKNEKKRFNKKKNTLKKPIET